MKRLLVIKADTNDGDYVHRVETVGNDFDVDRLQRIASVVSDEGGYNWVTGDIARDGEEPRSVYEGKLSEEDIEWFGSLMPWGEYGIHTIEDIRIYNYLSFDIIL